MNYRYPLVEIKWDDATASNSWIDPSTMELKDEIVVTVGFLIRADRRHIVVASTYDETHVNAAIQIPVGMIVSRKLLAGGPRRKNGRKAKV